jgi:NAD(P)H-hydrate epimerase
MATAGCGDVLTGILLALLAQNYRPDVAAVLGVYIHGLAADIALTTSSEEALTASDIINNLGHAFRQLRLS